MIQTLKNPPLVKTVTVCVKKALKTGSFPDSRKCANVSTNMQKVNPFDKKNYRPVGTTFIKSL